MSPRDDFDLANRAFDCFTLAEREQALTVFARLSYTSIIDRFLEAVHEVIRQKQSPPPPSQEPTDERKE